MFLSWVFLANHHRVIPDGSIKIVGYEEFLDIVHRQYIYLSYSDHDKYTCLCVCSFLFLGVFVFQMDGATYSVIQCFLNSCFVILSLPYSDLAVHSDECIIKMLRFIHLLNNYFFMNRAQNSHFSSCW